MGHRYIYAPFLLRLNLLLPKNKFSGIMCHKQLKGWKIHLLLGW